MSYKEIEDLIINTGKKSGLPQDTIDRITQPNREITVAVPVAMDNGKTKIFKGFRVQHNNARGPYK